MHYTYTRYVLESPSEWNEVDEQVVLKHEQEECSEVREHLREVVPEQTNVRLQITRHHRRAVALQHSLHTPRVSHVEQCCHCQQCGQHEDDTH